MSIISLVIALIVLGLIFYCVELIPMAAPFPTIIRVVALIIAVLILLQFLGINTGLPLVHA
jgi:hypothetical protein